MASSSPDITAEAQREEAALPTPISTSVTAPSRDNDEDGGGGGCRTPTTEESKLPSMLECPPPPRKRPRRAAACGRGRRRRRLWRPWAGRDPVPEIVSVGAEELQELFQWRDDEEAAMSGGLHVRKKPRCSDSDCKSD